LKDPGKKSIKVEHAFVYVKPDANTELVNQLLICAFASKKLEVIAHGEISNSLINDKMIIDSEFSDVLEVSMILGEIKVDIVYSENLHFMSISYLLI
jgi:hypothetical protein